MTPHMSIHNVTEKHSAYVCCAQKTFKQHVSNIREVTGEKEPQPAAQMCGLHPNAEF